jgi:hypothetical protein
MTTNNERAAQLDRAGRFLITARLLSITDADAYATADDALDVDRYDDVARDALLAVAQASFSSDDDYDDFRHELRVLLGPPFLDDVDADWE